MARLTKNFSSLEFYQLDKLLFLSEKYHTALSPLAKLVYTFFYDRSRLSDIKGFHDENDEVFFFYKIETIMHMLNCSKPKALAVKKELLNQGLLEEVKTGRASKLYLHALESDSYTEEEIQKFNEPDKDETVWKKEQIDKQKETFAKTIKERKEKKSKNNQVGNEKNFHRNNEKLEENSGEKLRSKKTLPHSISMINASFDENEKLRSKKYLLHSLSLINQHSDKKENTTKSISFTSEVNRIDPSNNNRVIIDNLLDKEIDQSLDNLFNEQLLFDLNKFYDKVIIQALDKISSYESIETMHVILQKAMLDLARGKFNAYPEAKEYSFSINEILSEINDYHDSDLAYEIRQTLIRATRFIHSGKQNIKNPQAYYYMSIQRAIIEYIQKHYELE